MSMTLTPTEKPQTLACLSARINDAHRKCEAALQSGLDHALEAGRLLTEAKSRVGHGAWLSWLEAHFEGSARTARAYMRVAKHWPELEAKRQRAADLSFRGAVRALTEERPKKEAEENSYGTMFRAAAKWAKLPELSPSVALTGTRGGAPERDGDVAYVYPTKSGNYYFVAVYRFAMDGGWVEYTSRPVRKDAVGYLLQEYGFRPDSDWCRWPADAISPEDLSALCLWWEKDYASLC